MEQNKKTALIIGLVLGGIPLCVLVVLLVVVFVIFLVVNAVNLYLYLGDDLAAHTVLNVLYSGNAVLCVIADPT